MSWGFVEKLALEFLPCPSQFVPGQKALEEFSIKCSGLNELEQACLVLGAARLERDCREILRRKNPGRRAFHVFFYRPVRDLPLPMLR